MAANSSRKAGRHFLQIPGPTPVPDRILRAMDTPVIDHRGPEFAKLGKRALDGIKTIFKTTNPVIIYTATGTGTDPAVIEARLREDKGREIKAVCVLHNETSTGCLSPIAEIRRAIDAAGHPALYMVDTISSLASAEYRHDEWGVDVSVGGAQK